MTRRKVEIIRDGLVLRGELDQEGADRPLVILMHGFGGSMGKTDREILPILNEKLLEAGFQTFRFDFDGHGSSDGAMKDMDILREILDAIAVLQYAERLPHSGKISLMGHSQGGVVAAMLAGLYHDRIGRVVLFAPAVTLVDDARQGTCMGVAYDPDHVPEMLQIGPNEVGGHYFRIAQSLPVLETASRFRGPVFFAIGAADEIVDPGSVNRWKSIYKDAEFHVIPDMNHAIEGSGREGLVRQAVQFLESGQSA